MLNKKVVVSFVTVCLLGSSLYAKQNDEERGNKDKLSGRKEFSHRVHSYLAS